MCQEDTDGMVATDAGPVQTVPSVDETVSIGPSHCSEWTVSVAGTKCWFS